MNEDFTPKQQELLSLLEKIEIDVGFFAVVLITAESNNAEEEFIQLLKEHPEYTEHEVLKYISENFDSDD